MSRGFRSALALAAMVVPLGVSPSGRAEVVNRIIATVDGDPITAHEVQRYREMAGSAEITEEQALEALITDKLLEKEVREKKIEVKSEDIDRYVDQVKERNRIDDYRFEAALAQQGLSLERYRERIKGELEKSQLVNREIRGRVSVSPAEVERHYQSNREEYRTGERVTVRAILFVVEPHDREAEVDRIRRKAEEVRQLAVGGRDFAELAKQFSEGPGAEKGGLLGTFARGELEPAMEQEVFVLAPGQLSTVVRGDRGFHIFRVDKLEPPGYRSLDESREQIREVLYQKAVEQRFQDWLAKDLRERHSVEVFN
ncbi:MAG: peptidylprolyl isomerase [Chloroflexi bacterium]|nr:peptidylprolyl isomerase [Chloroflexota bacterium]